MEKDFDTSDQSKRWSSDQKLRAAGFTIKGRSEKEEPIWERNGRVYKESEARKLLNGE